MTANPLRPSFLALPLLMALAACQSATPDGAAMRADTGEAALLAGALSACLASDRVPAAPADANPGEPRALEERQFAVPCPGQMHDDFVATLQRALIVRGYHEGTVTGVMDAATAEAVRRYQRPRGLDSATLSLDAARALGLVAVGREG